MPHPRILTYRFVPDDCEILEGRAMLLDETGAFGYFAPILDTNEEGVALIGRANRELRRCSDSATWLICALEALEGWRDMDPAEIVAALDGPVYQ